MSWQAAGNFRNGAQLIPAKIILKLEEYELEQLYQRLSFVFTA